MASRRHGRHRSGHARTWLGLVAGAAAVVLLSVGGYTLHVIHNSRGGHALADTDRPSATGTLDPDPTGRTASSGPAGPAAPAGSEAPSTSEATHSPTRPPVLTRGGKWWGVDSSGPITKSALANVQGWYRGRHRPQFWGRYLQGSYAVSKVELAFARAHHIYVYLIVNDRNCSQCSGADLCGNDRTAAQARTDSEAAARAARQLGIPRGAVLFKDIEQVSSCRGEPTAAYLLAWHRSLARTKYRTGFYGNTYRQSYAFPVAYCAALARSAHFTANVVLDMNEPEPQLGAPRGTIGPRNAPRFHPSEPSCTPPGATVIWQYGESTDPANVTDVDQARPGTAGLLAPDGTVTGR